MFMLKLYGPFLRMGFNRLKAIDPLQRGILVFTTRSAGGPGTHPWIRN